MPLVLTPTVELPVPALAPNNELVLVLQNAEACVVAAKVTPPKEADALTPNNVPMLPDDEDLLLIFDDPKRSPEGRMSVYATL